MKVSDKNPPSEMFLGMIYRGYGKAAKAREVVTCADIWDYVCGECIRIPHGFILAFEWDKTVSRAGQNRIGTIAQCIAGGYVLGLRLGRDAKGREIVEHV